MPGLITHYICGQSVLNNSNDDLKDILKKYEGIYNIGTQGPDMFFFYLPGHIRKSTKFLGIEMHNTNTGGFISSLIECSKELEGEDKDIALSYICGYLTHYALDANTHPYIYYKTGFRRKGDMLNAPKYSFYHRRFETSIDIMLLKLLSGKKPANKGLWEVLVSDSRENHVIANLLSKSLEMAYGRKISPEYLADAIKYMVNITRLIQSKGGRKKRFMELVEDFGITDDNISNLFHIQNIEEKLDFLNLEKNTWSNPWDNDVKYDESFVELYNKGVEEALFFVESTYDLYNSEILSHELLNIFGNRSMASGLDCELKLDWKFHDIIFMNN